MTESEFKGEYLEIEQLFLDNVISETTKNQRHWVLAKRFAAQAVILSSKLTQYWINEHDKLLEINKKLIKHNEILRMKNRKHI